MKETMLGLIGLYVIFATAYHLFTKHIFKTNPAWKKRAALFTGITNLVSALSLLSVAFITGGLAEWTPGWWIPVIITGILNIGVQYALTKAKTLEDVSLVSPIASTTPALVIFTSMILLNEYPSPLGWIGIWTIVIGTYLLNIQEYLDIKQAKQEKTSWRDWLAPFLMFKKSLGMRFAFLSAILGTFSLNFDAMAARKANVALAFGCAFLIVGIGNVVAAVYSKKPASDGHTPTLKFTWHLLVAGLLFAGVLWTGHSALRYGITPYVGVLKRLMVPTIIIGAWWLLGEKTNFQSRLLGGTIIAIGTALIALS